MELAMVPAILCRCQRIIIIRNCEKSSKYVYSYTDPAVALSRFWCTSQAAPENAMAIRYPLPTTRWTEAESESEADAEAINGVSEQSTT